MNSSVEAFERLPEKAVEVVRALPPYHSFQTCKFPKVNSSRLDSLRLERHGDRLL